MNGRRRLEERYWIRFSLGTSDEGPTGHICRLGGLSPLQAPPFPAVSLYTCNSFQKFLQVGGGHMEERKESACVGCRMPQTWAWSLEKHLVAARRSNQPQKPGFLISKWGWAPLPPAAGRVQETLWQESPHKHRGSGLFFFPHAQLARLWIWEAVLTLGFF